MKRVLIVGGTKGIGYSVAKQMARKHLVTVTGREKPAACPDSIDFISTDFLNPERIEETTERLIGKGEKINYLLFFQRFRGKQEAWDGEIQVSLTATKEMIEQLSDLFAPKEASIVLIASINASLISSHLPIGYHVAKAGLVQMAKYYATVLGPKQIRVNSISLGTILKKESKKHLLKNKSLVEFYLQQAPLRRMGTVKDVSNVVEFLCSSKSSFITGQDIVMNGGVSIQWQETLALNKVSQ